MKGDCIVELFQTKRQIFRKVKTCFYCHDDLTFKKSTLDHKVPKKKNGKNNYKNLVISCNKCNKLKGSSFDFVHFSEIIQSTEDRDYYWELRQNIKKEIVNSNLHLVKQIWNYRSNYAQNKKHIENFKKANLSVDKLVNNNKNIKKEIKNILRKIHLQIEEKTKKEIKKISKQRKTYEHIDC